MQTKGLRMRTKISHPVYGRGEVRGFTSSESGGAYLVTFKAPHPELAYERILVRAGMRTWDTPTKYYSARLPASEVEPYTLTPQPTRVTHDMQCNTARRNADVSTALELLASKGLVVHRPSDGNAYPVIAAHAPTRLSLTFTQHCVIGGVPNAGMRQYYSYGERGWINQLLAFVNEVMGDTWRGMPDAPAPYSASVYAVLDNLRERGYVVWCRNSHALVRAGAGVDSRTVARIAFRGSGVTVCASRPSNEAHGRVQWLSLSYDDTGWAEALVAFVVN